MRLRVDVVRRYGKRGVVNPLAAYEPLSGTDLERARVAVRANPDGVDVRNLAVVRIDVAVVPLDRGSVPYRYGDAVASVQFTDRDPVKAVEVAHRHVRAWSGQRRIGDGRAAALARRVGDDR